jgi:ABC-type transport system involved in cytochrome c biogenesis ATPase subunit/N-acetylglutamate synthase-like GNAT family acetyltransferase
VKRTERELQTPLTELVDVGSLRVDGKNPNRMGARQFEALKKSIKRWGFVVPIITNRDLLVADGEHRLDAAKDLGLRQVSVVRLPVDEVDRRMIRQVMNKIRGEHDLFMDAEEYCWLVSEGSRELLKGLLNENDLRIDNLLRLREPFKPDEEGFRAVAEQFASKMESNKLDVELEKKNACEPLALRLNAEFSTKAALTERTVAVCEAFGLGVDEAKRFVVFDDFSLGFRRGDLIYVTGDSGGGKTLLLKAFKNYFGEEAVELNDLQISPEETLIEGVGKDVKEAIEILSLCGLNDAFLFLRRFKELSDGQKYRYKLAKLVDCREKTVWLVDEFCASLDRVMARVVAFLFQKVARKLGKTVVLATTHGDLVEDFQPDVVVEKGFESDVKVSRIETKAELCSVCERVRVEKGSLEDYERLKRFHYKSGDRKESIGAREVFRLLHEDDLIGVIVYSNSYLNLKARNMVFGDRYVYTPSDLHTAHLINEEIARISRVVIHPKFRGIGLGELLVRETLSKVDAKVVEVLAVMARYNPFFERAGMLRVDYGRDETAIDKRIRGFLGERGFDFKLARSKAYCRGFFGGLDDAARKTLTEYLKEFVEQPFVKVKTVAPELLGRVFSSEGVYLYWVNGLAVV